MSNYDGGTTLTIWKKVLPITQTQDVSIPFGSTILIVREVGTDICMWYVCDPNAPMETRTIHIFQTNGTSKPFGAHYIGTALVGGLEYHVFDSQSSIVPASI